MTTQPKVVFLQQKIMELQQGLFYNCSNSVLKLPVSIINVLHVDEVGQVWFTMLRPTQHLNEFDKEFPSRVEFYKKGKPYFLHVTGKASIVSDPEEINNAIGISDEIKKHAFSKIILLKMKISDIYYYPYPTHKAHVRKELKKITFNPSGFIKTLQYIVKDIIPVFQSH